MVATTARAGAYKCMMVPRETSTGIKSEPRQQVHIKGKEMNDPEFDTFPMSRLVSISSYHMWVDKNNARVLVEPSEPSDSL